jgi:CRISPR-associated protein Cmr3
MSCFCFVKPCDVFMPRGNTHFGVGSGDFGQIKMLPQPSVFAGAFRSKLASKSFENLDRIINKQEPAEPEMAECLGSFEKPGNFRISMATVGKIKDKKIELFFSLPSDLVVYEEYEQPAAIYMLTPSKIPGLIKCQNSDHFIPVLKAPAKKPSPGWWLNPSGFAKYLRGQKPDKTDLIHQGQLWKKESRVGIALDTNTGSTKEGMLYSAEAINFLPDTGFIIEINGADKVLQNQGELRLGGDGHAAVFEKVDLSLPDPDFEKIKIDRKFKLIMATPGLFAEGWLPDGLIKENDEYFIKTDEFTTRLKSAAIAGNDIISGWNLVENLPKNALRTVSTGSVYWFDQFEGSTDALKAFIDKGLWLDNSDLQRVTEGYNRAFIANYNSKTNTSEVK